MKECMDFFSIEHKPVRIVVGGLEAGVVRRGVWGLLR
jgi:hypothetical protein